MRNSYSVSLPVKPYVKKYVETVEGNPILFNGKSMLCMIIRAFLQNKKSTGLSKAKLQTSVTTRTAQIEIIIPTAYINVIGVSVSDDGVVIINRWLEEVFERALRQFIKQHTKAAGRYKGFKNAYEAFADFYNIEIEEDITLDGLQKMDYRFRKKGDDDNKNNNNFFSALVPSL